MKRTPKQIKTSYHTKKSLRANFEDLWQRLSDYVIPNKNDINKDLWPGQARQDQIFDNTAIVALEQLAGALHSLLTNPQSLWFELFTGDAKIDDRDDVRVWLQDTARRVLEVLNNSNFNTEMHEVYLDLGSFGTVGLFIEEDPELVVRFSAKNVKGLVISENNKGWVDEIYRCFKWNARNIVSEFGDAALKNDKIKKAYDDNSEDLFEVIHAIYPQTAEKGPLSQFKYISQYILECDDFELKASGYYEWPCPTPRWSKSTNEVYGRSPAMTAYPNVRTLNLIKEQVIKAAAKTIDPPLALPDDGYLLPLKTFPGGLNFYRAGAEPVVPLLGQHVNLDPRFNFEVVNEIKENIKNAFYSNVLQLAESDRMTATEVNARLEQQIRILGPLVGRQQDELLSPLIFRVMKIMERNNLLLPAPQAIVEAGGVQVRYSGPLAKSQRLSQTNSLLRTIELVTPVVNADPTVLDNIDGDEYLREVSRLQNFPQKVIRTREQVAAIRKQRQDQAAQEKAMVAQQMQAEQAGQMAPALKAIQG